MMAPRKESRNGQASPSAWDARRRVGPQRQLPGYWSAAATLPFGPDGKQPAASYAEIESVGPVSAMAEALAAWSRHAGNRLGDGTVSEWLAFWQSEILPGRVKPRTLQAYREVCRMYVEPHVGAVKLAELGPEHVTHMLNRLEAAGLSTGTRRHVRDVLYD